MTLQALTHNEPRDQLPEILASRHSSPGRCGWGSAFSARSPISSWKSHACPVFSGDVTSDLLWLDSWKAIGYEMFHSTGGVHAVPTNPPAWAETESSALHRCCLPP